MADRRETGFWFGVLAVAFVLLAMAGFVFSSPTPATLVRIDGIVERTEPDAGWLFVNTSSTPDDTVRIAVTGRTDVYECETGPNLFSCASRESMAWIEPGDGACVEALFVDGGGARARAVYVNATCATAPEMPATRGA